MHSLPTISQIREVRRLLRTNLYEIPAIVRMTDVSLRDVFRIGKSLPTTGLYLDKTSK